jgi:hypothetical protein
MRFDLHFGSVLRDRIRELAQRMRSEEDQQYFSDREKKQISERLAFFSHTTTQENLYVAGAGSGGDFPSVSYGDSFIYAAVAESSVYKSDAISGLREVGSTAGAVFHFALIPEDEEARRISLDDAFASLSGASISDVIEASDYRQLKSAETRRNSSVDVLMKNLIRPHAADAGNIGIQLRSTAEFGAVLRLLRSKAEIKYVLIDGTLSLPLVTRTDVSLFHEHLKRLCCVEARKQGIGLFTLSKTHGLPAMGLLEELAREREERNGNIAEHWYLRLPVNGADRWETTLTPSRRLPPPGAVTYIIRFHRTTPTMRLDMDREFWLEYVRGATEEKTRANEQSIFESLDYLTHDQRCYGYPYPLRAAHDSALLTKSERAALRKQIVEAAVDAGMKRSLFRRPTQSSD